VAAKNRNQSNKPENAGAKGRSGGQGQSDSKGSHSRGSQKPAPVETHPKPKAKILFCIKRRYNYGHGHGHGYGGGPDGRGISYGLVNSCKFVANALALHGVESKIVQLEDNSKIDKEVHDYKPTHVFVEALWVVPDKFPVLMKYPWNRAAKWSIRLHSQIPFLGYEGISIEWIRAYMELAKHYPNVGVSANNIRVVDEFKQALGLNLDYTPNIYIPDTTVTQSISKKKHIDIGCFGAIRPFKGQLSQAVGAMAFAEKQGLTLYFHINSSRFENMGESILKNLRNLFVNTRHKLVEHPWVNHEDFLEIVRKMDIVCQVSYTETFDIVAADAAWTGIPLVASKEVEWASHFYQCQPGDAKSIASKLNMAWGLAPANFHVLNKIGLERHNRKAVEAWLAYLEI